MSSELQQQRSLSPEFHRSLFFTLRVANVRYSVLAAQFRASREPSHHARQRAANLGLTVSTEAARACPQRYVSKDPLPIIEIASPLRVDDHDVEEEISVFDVEEETTPSPSLVSGSSSSAASDDEIRSIASEIQEVREEPSQSRSQFMIRIKRKTFVDDDVDSMEHREGAGYHKPPKAGGHFARVRQKFAKLITFSIFRDTVRSQVPLPFQEETQHYI